MDTISRRDLFIAAAIAGAMGTSINKPDGTVIEKNEANLTSLAIDIADATIARLDGEVR